MHGQDIGELVDVVGGRQSQGQRGKGGQSQEVRLEAHGGARAAGQVSVGGLGRVDGPRRVFKSPGWER